MKLLRLVKDNIFLIGLTALALLHFVVVVRMNLFSYNNFDFGKFDLGNMVQMLWNTQHGRFMYLTDYFGANVPRWAMSHVDPILVLFLPLFMLIPHPLTIVFAQIILVISGAFVLYYLGILELRSKAAGALLGAAYLFYPAIGFLNARTGFHGVTAALVFFMLAFYVFERMYVARKFTRKGSTLFWLFLVITMSGKEQLPLYVFIYGVFILIFRQTDVSFFKPTKEWFKSFFRTSQTKIALSMMAVSLVWFVIAFLILIPSYASYRVDGYKKFAASLNIDTTSTRDVALPNYFLSRYGDFGESYGEVLINVLLNNQKAIKVVFDGDKSENLRQTFAPLLYIPLAYPQIFMMALPDFMANFLTTAGGVGTGEITNHRISMIIPILFISVLFAIAFFSDTLSFVLAWISKKKFQVKPQIFSIVISAAVLASCVRTSFVYNNPVYLWLNQAVIKRFTATLVLAKTDSTVAQESMKVGDVFKLSRLDNKDRECANKVVKMIPENVSVSGPDYLGDRLAMRETYAIFPALYKEADYVIVDVFSRKLLSILDLNNDMIKEVVGGMLNDPNYDMVTGCGNLFVFKKVGYHQKDPMLPIQERAEYPSTKKYPLADGVNLADFTLPPEMTRGENSPAKFVYIKDGNKSLSGYVMFTTFINEKTGELYQVANLPSFGLFEPADWNTGLYYVENVNLNLPNYLDSGEYKAFIGMSNSIRTRSIFLGKVNVK